MENKNQKWSEKYEVTIKWMVSGLYICGVAGYGIWWGISENNISLSKGGDFLSGSLYPLTILWLVWIYQQQRQEMKNIFEVQQNIKDLEKEKVEDNVKQTNELRHQNYNMGRQCRFAEEKLEPTISMCWGDTPDTKKNNFKFLFSNHKTDCQIISFHTDNLAIFKMSFQHKETFFYNYKHTLGMHYKTRMLWKTDDLLFVEMDMTGITDTELIIIFKDDIKRKWTQKIEFLIGDYMDDSLPEELIIPCTNAHEDIMTIKFSETELLEGWKYTKEFNDQNKT